MILCLKEVNLYLIMMFNLVLSFRTGGAGGMSSSISAILLDVLPRSKFSFLWFLLWFNHRSIQSFVVSLYVDSDPQIQSLSCIYFLVLVRENAIIYKLSLFELDTNRSDSIRFDSSSELENISVQLKKYRVKIYNLTLSKV